MTALVVLVTGLSAGRIFPIMGPPTRYTGSWMRAPPAASTQSERLAPRGTRRVTGETTSPTTLTSFSVTGIFSCSAR